jgi:hypothetical protein
MISTFIHLVLRSAACQLECHQLFENDDNENLIWQAPIRWETALIYSERPETAENVRMSNNSNWT